MHHVAVTTVTCVSYRLIHKCSDKCGLTLDMILAMAEPRYAQKKAAEEKGGREILSDDIRVRNSDCRLQISGGSAPVLCMWYGHSAWVRYKCLLTTSYGKQVHLPGESIKHSSNGNTC